MLTGNLPRGYYYVYATDDKAAVYGAPESQASGAFCIQRDKFELRTSNYMTPAKTIACDANGLERREIPRGRDPRQRATTPTPRVQHGVGAGAVRAGQQRRQARRRPCRYPSFPRRWWCGRRRPPLRRRRASATRTCAEAAMISSRDIALGGLLTIGWLAGACSCAQRARGTAAAFRLHAVGWRSGCAARQFIRFVQSVRRRPHADAGLHPATASSTMRWRKRCRR